MSRTVKIVLAVVGGLVACCCILILAATVLLPRFGTQFMSEIVSTDENVGEVARSIVEFHQPAGMEEEMAMNFLGMKTAVFRGSDEQSLIMLMQFPRTLAGDEEEMRRQMDESFGRQFGIDDQRLEVVSGEEVTINGQPATLTTSESVDVERTVRQVVGVFQSKDGSPAMVVAVAPVDRWQSDGIDRFLESMQQEGTGR
jgi:hypothetical protein